MGGPVRVSIADLADGAAGSPLLGPGGTVHEPLLVVELTGAEEPATVERAVRRAAESDRILVGWSNGDAPRALGEALDIIIIDEERIERLHGAVAANPLAALTLRDVLRTTEGMRAEAALDVESYAYSTLLGGAEFARWLAAQEKRQPPPEADEPVLLDRDGDRLHVTLNRPERRNAYGRQLRDALVDALQIAVLDETVGRIVLDGAGPAFCAGGDLAEFGTAPDLATAHLIRTRAGAGRLMHRLAERLEVHVHGPCVGAGIELPAFAGRVVAHPDVTFRLPEVSMGLIPGAGGTVSIPRRIGRRRTFWLALTGEPLDAATAQAWGLIDETHP
ncbi:enoyl-CoA hydratase/isomerase family protein [Actinomadura barringtoniae]|uniref:Enoyl-CoA hydratase/isomerase family protein n=1 Tax=Actinomadura barringtoniae TaxID=1427535 RepID=A0A939PCR8_9ACTN|nr:enoyl-CoA hydratase/isomerase family protein [Actinomadura barringtoniae]MBO2447663.1 enoyl-CoA hydratase/isomerase family protein [Actinomadura barringtoniae]